MNRTRASRALPENELRNRRPGLTLDETLDFMLSHNCEKSDSGCLIWQRGISSTGYPQLNFKGKVYKLYRLLWEREFGSIPDGMVIDHDCHNKAAERGECSGGKCEHRKCLEVSHLKLSTHKANTLASPLSKSSIHAAKTCCDKGHPLSGDNLGHISTRPGVRVCKTCVAERKRRYHKQAVNDRKYIALGSVVRVYRMVNSMDLSDISEVLDEDRSRVSALERGVLLSESLAEKVRQRLGFTGEESTLDMALGDSLLEEVSSGFGEMSDTLRRSVSDRISSECSERHVSFASLSRMSGVSDTTIRKIRFCEGGARLSVVKVLLSFRGARPNGGVPPISRGWGMF